VETEKQETPGDDLAALCQVQYEKWMAKILWGSNPLSPIKSVHMDSKSACNSTHYYKGQISNFYSSY